MTKFKAAFLSLPLIFGLAVQADAARTDTCPTGWTEHGQGVQKNEKGDFSHIDWNELARVARGEKSAEPVAYVRCASATVMRASAAAVEPAVLVTDTSADKLSGITYTSATVASTNTRTFASKQEKQAQIDQLKWIGIGMILFSLAVMAYAFLPGIVTTLLRRKQT
ncbi:hypothetical protein NBRC116590_29040 [Pelagimonas sp. KU-00592-HH]|uniref:hypothetical protein n=1 Tax=Pelagimonas sp. KU-00592-HH TaxID=3127651 RepID=UPI0031085C80